MAVLFHSSDSQINLEVGEYQQFPKPEVRNAETERTSKHPQKELKHLSLVLLIFGLLYVLQGILNICLRVALSETQEERCPQSWLLFGSSCYYISSQRRRLSWDDSRQDCVQRDADLVVINSRQEQAFVAGLTLSAWVGMTDRKKEGTWIWVDGTPVNKDELLWAPGQPDDSLGGEDCGDIRSMINFSGLNDYDCGAADRWICEKNLTLA